MSKDDIKDIKQQIRDLQGEIKDLQREVRDIVHGCERLAYELRRISDADAAERKMMALQLENTLLKFERHLPQGNQDNP